MTDSPTSRITAIHVAMPSGNTHKAAAQIVATAVDVTSCDNGAIYPGNCSTLSRRTENTLVMDNLNTHSPGALYQTFPPDQAKELWDRFEFIYTPKHGSWLNVAEIELNVSIGQCLDRRIGSMNELREEVAAWQHASTRFTPR